MCFRCAIWRCKQTWTRHKIINKHEHILPALSSYLGCNCPIHFRNCLEIVLMHIIFEITSKIKIKGVKSGEYAAHSVSHLLHCLNHCRLSLEVLGVTPSCWNHCSFLSIPLRRPNTAQNFLMLFVVFLGDHPVFSELILKYTLCMVKTACGNRKKQLWNKSLRYSIE